MSYNSRGFSTIENWGYRGGALALSGTFRSYPNQWVHRRRWHGHRLRRHAVERQL